MKRVWWVSFWALVGFFASAEAQAQSKVRYPLGKGTTKVLVAWQAWGCAGVKSWALRVCHSAKIGVGETKSYKFKAGTSKQKVIFFCGLSSTQAYIVDTSNTKLHRISETPTGQFLFDGIRVPKDCTAP